MAHWMISPTTPVNVYILDRTVGRDYQEHRALTWTLNFLKVRHDGKIYPGGNQGPSAYNFARDYYGFLPEFNEAQQPKVEEAKEAAGASKTPEEAAKGQQLIHVGRNRPLPASLATPGVLFLTDTTGEFVEYDARRDKYVRYRNPARGIQPADLPAIQRFQQNGGLLIGEWNSISNATQLTDNNEAALVQRGLRETRQGLNFLVGQELPRRERDLNLALRYNNRSGAQTLSQQVADTRARIVRHRRQIEELSQAARSYQTRMPGLQAQEAVARMLHVRYRGWYGRFVDHFEEEREYDYQMWKNVRDSLQRRSNRPDVEPRGAGFVFYRDGSSKVYNPDTRRYEENPFSDPVVITEDELADGNRQELAAIHRSGKEGIADDPLLKNVAAQVPYRYWFDVVDALPGARVLTWHKLRIKKPAADRLLGAGFPAESVAQDKKNPNLYVITLPALVASREGNTSSGQLRSLYFAGDASDYSLVPRFAEILPATGGIAYFLGQRFGPYPMQYYWKYYQPVMQNIFAGEKAIVRSS
jgi:hypothetical protein